MGLNCMRGLVEKFGEKIVTEAIDILESYLERATDNSQIIGISKALLNMAAAAPTKLLSDMKMRYINIMDPYLANEAEEVRHNAVLVYITVFQRAFEAAFIAQNLKWSFLNKLHTFVVNKEEEKSRLLIGSLDEMIELAPDLKIEDKILNMCQIKIHDSPITIAQARLMRCVAPNVAHNIFNKKFYHNFLVVLVKELTAD